MIPQFVVECQWPLLNQIYFIHFFDFSPMKTFKYAYVQSSLIVCHFVYDCVIIWMCKQQCTSRWSCRAAGHCRAGQIISHYLACQTALIHCRSSAGAAEVSLVHCPQEQGFGEDLICGGQTETGRSGVRFCWEFSVLFWDASAVSGLEPPVDVTLFSQSVTWRWSRWVILRAPSLLHLWAIWWKFPTRPR